MIEAQQRETQYHQKKNSEKMDYAKFFNTRTTQARHDFNLQRIKTHEEKDPLKIKLPHKLGFIPAFYPQNKLNELKHFTSEMDAGTQSAQLNMGYRTTQEYKDLLAKAASAIPGPRRTHRQILRIQGPNSSKGFPNLRAGTIGKHQSVDLNNNSMTLDALRTRNKS